MRPLQGKIHSHVNLYLILSACAKSTGLLQLQVDATGELVLCLSVREHWDMKQGLLLSKCDNISFRANAIAFSESHGDHDSETY